MYRRFIVLGVLCILHILYSKEDNYGKFRLKVNSLVTCKGPKRKDCCIITVKMEDDVKLFYDINIKQNVAPDKGKILAIMNGKPLIRLQMKKPCDHLFIGPLFKALLNVTPDCLFIKGHYTFNLDIEEVAKKYYGGMFLYGNMTFKSIFYNDECNFSCTMVSVTFLPTNGTS